MTAKKGMTRREMCKITASGILLTATGAQQVLAAQDHKPDSLPKPGMGDGKSLMHALKQRKSSRKFSETKVPMQVLSDLLWAADGVNRQDSGKRTAPSAWNWQNIDTYVATADGVSMYDAESHQLKPHLPEDIRSLTGTQAFVAKAPVNLILVADYADLKVYDFKARRHVPAPQEEVEFYSIANAGFISQNVYLYAATAGLATVVRGLIDKESLGKALKLRREQKVILAQTVGYPPGA